MTASIRDYDGEIFLCTACGQPCYHEEDPEYGKVPMHFIECWDFIYCPSHPLAGGTITMEWDLSDHTLQDLKEKYGKESPWKLAFS